MAKEEISELTLNKPSDENHQQGKHVKANITGEMQKAYLDYAMSVIVSRALPDVRDGLKPVHRRIIYAMQDQNMTASNKYYKSATVVGEVLGKYHPHGGEAVYDTMVRMAQDFTLRYPLIDGQGNFGSIDNDPPAAMRYTEARLQKISEQLYSDIGNDTVEFYMNDLQNMEPVILPAYLPNLLMNGVAGIAVGMATNIPPHNLNELIDGISLLINQASTLGKAPTDTDVVRLLPFEGTEQGAHDVKVSTVNFESEANVEDLIKVIPGPDFPTGGIIYDQKESIRMYATGRGKIVTRAKMHTEEIKGRNQLIVTEVPYQVNKATLITKIADLVKNKKIVGISDLRDESNREGIRVVIELKRDAIPKKVENRLYKYTQLQNNFNANMVALVHGEPKLLTLKVILEEFIKHRQIVIVRRTLHLLKKIKAREHILQGLVKALDILDEVIALIRASKDSDTAKLGLIEKFGFTEIQSQAILDMQLRKLAALERKKIEDELNDILSTINKYETLLASPEEIIKTVTSELNELKERFGDKRRSKVVKGKVGELSEIDLVADDKCIVTISKSGYIKRMIEDTYRRQARGGKGVKGQELKDEDIIETIRTCNTHDTALFFTNKGKVYKLNVWDIPEFSRTAKGTALVNFLSITQDEKVEAFLTVDKTVIDSSNGYIMIGTTKGVVKKTSMADFANIRSSGIMAINLTDGDSLSFAKLTTGKDEVLLVTGQGQSIRFNEDKVRPMGRNASGVIGIKFVKKEDTLVGMDVIEHNTKETLYVAIITEQGYGKKTVIKEYKLQNRGGSGILTYKVTAKTGKVVTARIINKAIDTDMLIVSASGKIIRLDSKNVPLLGRATMGVRLIKLSTSDKVASIAFIDNTPELVIDETSSIAPVENDMEEDDGDDDNEEEIESLGDTVEDSDED